MEPENKGEQGEVTPAVAGPEATVKTETTKSGEESGLSYKTLAIIGYIIPFLFFIPLLDDKTKNIPFARFHANQQVLILIAWLGVEFIGSTFLMILGGVGYLVMQLVYLAFLALIIIGALNAHKGLMKELPLIGHFRIIK